MMEFFQASDKVVLSPAGVDPRYLPLKPRLQRGRVYCVREVVALNDGSAQAVRLVGVLGPVQADGWEAPINSQQFLRVGPKRSTSQQEGGA